MRRSPSSDPTLSSRKGSQPKKSKVPSQAPTQPICPPPSYRSVSPPQQPPRRSSPLALRESRGRSTSVNDVLRGTISQRAMEVFELDNNFDADAKAYWIDRSHSDNEAINVVTAGASDSEALDEQTGSMALAESTTSNSSGLNGAASRSIRPISMTTLTPAGFHRASRPSDLDLSRAHVSRIQSCLHLQHPPSLPSDRRFQHPQHPALPPPWGR